MALDGSLTTTEMMRMSFDPTKDQSMVTSPDAGLQRISAFTGGNSYYFNTVSGGTNLVKTGPGVLQSVIFGNTPLTSAVVLYDGTTSATTNIIAKFNTSVSAQAYYLGATVSAGITISAGSVLDNITVIYT